MKKFIILLLVISFTALTAQNYQYFTAKQGIPKALEIAKAYFNNDSVDLYSIKCVRWKVVQSDHFPYYDYMVLIDEINPYNDTTGKSLYWYYLVCDSNDSCNYFRLWMKAGNYEVDSVLKGFGFINRDYPIYEDDIYIDTDSLVKCMDTFCKQFLNYSELFFSKNEWLFDTVNLPIWEYHWQDVHSISGVDAYINTKTCECHRFFLEVSEKHKSNSISFNIKSELNTDNITIETNSDLIQEAELRLYDQVGVLLFADKMNDKSYQLNTYNFPSCLYLLQIKYGGDVITKTVMVVH